MASAAASPPGKPAQLTASEAIAAVLANASGRYGTTRDYVEQTISALRSHATNPSNCSA